MVANVGWQPVVYGTGEQVLGICDAVGPTLRVTFDVGNFLLAGEDNMQALAQVAGRKATVAFTPHLVPMTRGILATCYARPRATADARRLYAAAEACYRGEPFIKLVPLEKGRSAHTGWATGSNLAFLSYAVNARTGLVVALGAIDNLGKGASAQALQNANLMTGQPETAGLSGLPLWP